MSLFTALLETYNEAEKHGFVDKKVEENGLCLLPIFHDRARSDGKTIIDVRLDEDGNFVKAQFVPEGQYIEFPTTEDSIGRSSGLAPHALSDKLKYLSPKLSSYIAEKKGRKHFEAYIDQLNSWIDYAKEHPNKLLQTIGQYLNDKESDIADDIARSLFGEGSKILHSGKVEYLEEEKVKNKDLTSITVTFSVELKDAHGGLLTVTDDIGLHQNYIGFMMNQLKNKPKDICDVSLEKQYIVNKHYGLLGNAKVISGQRKENFKGRFKDPNDLLRVGFITSQKMFLMLQFLIDNKQNSQYLSSGCYLVNWFSNDIYNNKEFNPIDPLRLNPDSLLNQLEGSRGLGDQMKENNKVAFSLGGGGSQKYNQILTGNASSLDNISYFITLVEKTSDGRIAIKYFRELTGSQLLRNVEHWYRTTEWKQIVGGVERKWSPPIYQILSTLYGVEDEKGGKKQFRVVGEKTKGLVGSYSEDLIRCVIDRNPFPTVHYLKAWANAKKPQAFKELWATQFSMDLIVIRKYLIDLPDYHPRSLTGEDICMLDTESNNQSYLYGRLLAVYDRIEKDALYFKGKNNERSQVALSKEGSEDSSLERKEQRSTTNAMKLWSAYIDRPFIINLTLSKKIMPYLQILKTENKGRAIVLESILSELQNRIAEVSAENNYGSLDERFLFGYYGQSQSFYEIFQTKNIR